MDIINNPIFRRYVELLKVVGASTIHSLFPNDFEFYMNALELISSDGKTVDLFIFPIMPQSISEQETNLVNIDKTFGGIVTTNTSTFTPLNISLTGNFGKKFKFLLGRNMVDATAIQFSSGEYEVKGRDRKTFSNTAKTGYGALKVLQSIYELSKKKDKKGNPFKLCYYNLAFGTAYTVKVRDINFKQSLDSNMIWNYTLNMTAIAPVVDVKPNSGKSISRMMRLNVLSMAIGITANVAGTLIKNAGKNYLKKTTSKIN